MVPLLRHPRSLLRRWMSPAVLGLALMLGGQPARAQWDTWVDQLQPALRGSSPDGHYQWRVSGQLNLAARYADGASADLLYLDADEQVLVAPVIRAFLDVDAGPLYLFGHTRADRGFDARDQSLRARVEELALRWRPPATGWSIQAGKFATVFGSWARRHAAWDYPFAIAPLAQDSLVGLWDVKGLPATAKLEEWPHITPLAGGAALTADEQNRIPIIWGPVYAYGVAAFWNSPHWEIALETKHAGLSSRPSNWDDHPADAFREPALAGRVAWRPNPTWNLGLSIAHGLYLRPNPETVAAGFTRADYTQTTMGFDLTYAHRNRQLWVEGIWSGFALPGVGRAEVVSLTLEGKQRLSPLLALAARISWQDYQRVPLARGASARWGRDTWRAEVGPVVRLAAHAQLRLQASLLHEKPALDRWHPGAGVDLVLRF